MGFQPGGWSSALEPHPFFVVPDLEFWNWILLPQMGATAVEDDGGGDDDMENEGGDDSAQNALERINLKFARRQRRDETNFTKVCMVRRVVVKLCFQCRCRGRTSSLRCKSTFPPPFLCGRRFLFFRNCKFLRRSKLRSCRK